MTKTEASKSAAKLVKAAPAVKSYALYNRGAKPAQWRIEDASGAVLFHVRGSQVGYAPPSYSIYKVGAKYPAHVSASFDFVKRFVAQLNAATGSAQ